MTRTVRCGLVQATFEGRSDAPPDVIKKIMVDKHVALIEQAAKKDVQILCLQELFYGPYFCAEQEMKWYAMAERIPGGPTTTLMREQAET